MFERYTEAARRVITVARAEAFAYGSPKIEAEHLLPGVAGCGDAAARGILSERAAAAIRERVDAAYPQPRRQTQAVGDLPLSHESMRALAYAAEEAELDGGGTIGATHLLRGLLRESECLAAQILGELKVTLEGVRAEPYDFSALETSALVWAGSMGQPLASHHVLLALLGDPDSGTARFLNEHGVTEDSVCERFGGAQE